MARIKVHELRNKSKPDLLTQLKAELGLLRVAKVTGGAPNKLSKIKVHGKVVYCTGGSDCNFHRSKRLLVYKKKKYLPLDLRPKNTRVIRKRLPSTRRP